MKRNRSAQPAPAYLTIGLLLLITTPLICRYLPAPDIVRGFLRGFLTSLALTLQLIAVMQLRRKQKQHHCGKAAR